MGLWRSAGCAAASFVCLIAEFTQYFSRILGFPFLPAADDELLREPRPLSVAFLWPLGRGWGAQQAAQLAAAVTSRPRRMLLKPPPGLALVGHKDPSRSRIKSVFRKVILPTE